MIFLTESAQYQYHYWLNINININHNHKEKINNSFLLTLSFVIQPHVDSSCQGILMRSSLSINVNSWAHADASTSISCSGTSLSAVSKLNRSSLTGLTALSEPSSSRDVDLRIGERIFFTSFFFTLPANKEKLRWDIVFQHQSNCWMLFLN